MQTSERLKLNDQSLSRFPLKKVKVKQPYVDNS